METNMNKQKLSDYFNLTPLKMTSQLEEYKQEDALYKNTIPLVNPNYIFGLEIEVEQIHQVDKPKFKSYWDVTPDNSLRNSGIEFVSKPLKAFQIEGALDQLVDNLKINGNPPEFTPRTSTHIHMNVRDLTISQIFNLVLIYTSVENVLFNWVGHGRDKNIFCIKLTDTEYIHQYTTLLNDPARATRYWNKYTALNLKPMESKGTIEFRHMYGTMDKEIILPWINFISCIKAYAKTVTTQDLYAQLRELNTNSLYEEYLYSIFGNYTKYLLLDITNLQTLLEDTITYVKLSTLVKKQPTTIDWETPPAIRFTDTNREQRTIGRAILDEVDPQEIPPTPYTPPLEYQPIDPTLTVNPIPNIRQTVEFNRMAEQFRLFEQQLGNTTHTPVNRPTRRPVPTIEERVQQRAAARQRMINNERGI